MSSSDEMRQKARATWSAGNWDDFSNRIASVGTNVLDRIGVKQGDVLLDVGTGSGGTIAVPAALRGATVTGSDVTPELFEHARRRASEAGVEIEWIEADAQDLPFGDASYDVVTSTFGAMFAPDHQRAAAELVRVCRPGGTIAMTTWVTDGFVGEMFKLNGRYMPPPPPGMGTPPQWGSADHVNEMFEAAGVTPDISRESITFEFKSVEDAVDAYSDFGPMVVARAMLEPQGKWDEFIDAFAGLLESFGVQDDDGLHLASPYFLITVTR